jgi:hypothetical protein
MKALRTEFRNKIEENHMKSEDPIKSQLAEIKRCRDSVKIQKKYQNRRPQRRRGQKK